MPKYSYSCSGCGKDFELHHSMFETVDKCIACESFEVERKPLLSFTTTKKNNSGQLVKDFIENTKKDVEIEKEKLKGEYND